MRTVWPGALLVLFLIAGFQLPASHAVAADAKSLKLPQPNMRCDPLPCPRSDIYRDRFRITVNIVQCKAPPCPQSYRIELLDRGITLKVTSLVTYGTLPESLTSLLSDGHPIGRTIFFAGTIRHTPATQRAVITEANNVRILPD